MTRLSRQLETHGLSFGDALNLALFLLTLASLYLAYQGVKLARVTLDEARQAGKDQAIQFQEQMKQQKLSANELENARTLLSTQSDILRKLQHTSEQQLDNLNRAEARLVKQEKARPMVMITGSCDTQLILRASEKDFRRSRTREYQNSATITPGKPGESYCHIMITNEGGAELTKANLEADVRCVDAGSNDNDVVITYIDGAVNGYSSGSLITEENAPSISKSDRTLNTNFTVKYGTCAKFDVHLTLDADNLPSSATTTTVVPLSIQRQ